MGQGEGMHTHGVGWNILRKIHAYFLWVWTKTDSYGGGKKCRKVFEWSPWVHMDVPSSVALYGHIATLRSKGGNKDMKWTPHPSCFCHS